MHNVQYAVLGYLGYRTYALSRLPDCPQPGMEETFPGDASKESNKFFDQSPPSPSACAVVLMHSEFDVGQCAMDDTKLKQAVRMESRKIDDGETMDQSRIREEMGERKPPENTAASIDDFADGKGKNCEESEQSPALFESVELETAQCSSIGNQYTCAMAEVENGDSANETIEQLKTCIEADYCASDPMTASQASTSSFDHVPMCRPLMRGEAGKIDSSTITPTDQPPIVKESVTAMIIDMQNGDADVEPHNPEPPLATGECRPACLPDHKARRTYRRQLPVTDELWTPVRKKLIRRPKRTKNPFFSFKNANWWHIRAQMPQLRRRGEIMQEVVRRWREMPQEAKEIYKVSSSRKIRRGLGERAVDDQGEGPSRMQNAKQRLNAARWNGSRVQLQIGPLSE